MSSATQKSNGLPITAVAHPEVGGKSFLSSVPSRRNHMKRVAVLLVVLAPVAGVEAFMAPASGRVTRNAASNVVTEIPPGYRDWRLVSVAHEEGNLHSFAAVLGNEAAIKAYREGKLPFPDGAIIAALHYRHLPSEENNQVFGREQSFIPGLPTNIQFMTKDSIKYASTGGWGFGHFNATDRKPADEKLMKTCFPCHAQAKDRDLVFTRYAP
jgi:cytochrome P460